LNSELLSIVHEVMQIFVITSKVDIGNICAHAGLSDYYIDIFSTLSEGYTISAPFPLG